MLKKNISLLTGISIAISMVIGSGLFGLPGLAVEATDPVTAVCAWLLIIVIMPAMIHIFSVLGRKYPSSEGVALYATLGFGRWSRGGILLLACGTLIVGMPAFFMVGGGYITSLFGLDSYVWTIPCAIVLAIFTTIINLCTIEKMALINKGAVLLILFIVAYIVMSQFFSNSNNIAIIHAAASQCARTVSFNGIWLSASIVFWAFQGWENLTFGFGEVKYSNKNIPIIFWASYFFVAAIYIIFSIAVSLAAINGLSIHGLNGLAVMLPGGMFGRVLLTLMVFIIIANANSWVFGCSRAFLSAANAGILPKSLRKLSNKGVPILVLLTALVIYIAIMIYMYIFHVKAQIAFLLTAQGFVILYGGAILAFIKQKRDFLSRVISIIAVVSWIFLMHGFGWMIVYPLTLILLGIFIGGKHYAVGLNI